MLWEGPTQPFGPQAGGRGEGRLLVLGVPREGADGFTEVISNPQTQGRLKLPEESLGRHDRATVEAGRPRRRPLSRRASAQRWKTVNQFLGPPWRRKPWQPSQQGVVAATGCQPLEGLPLLLTCEEDDTLFSLCHHRVGVWGGCVYN